MKLLLYAFLVIAGIYSVLCALVYFNQEKLLFFPAPIATAQNYLQKYADNEIEFYHSGVHLRGWLLNPGQSRLLIYFGGNAEEVSAQLDDFQKLEDTSVLLLNYRGYGNSEGMPGQDELFSDAQFVYDEMLLRFGAETGQVVLFGRSLGSGVAAHLAAQRPVDALILVTPYSSITDVARSAYPFLPIKLLLKHPFNSQKYLKNLNIPALVLMAQNDRIIPAIFSEKLVAVLGDYAERHILPATDHNDIHTAPQYWPLIQQFLGKL